MNCLFFFFNRDIVFRGLNNLVSYKQRKLGVLKIFLANNFRSKSMSLFVLLTLDIFFKKLAKKSSSIKIR
jgi:hypothetical protein